MEAKDRAPDEINKEKMRQQQMEDEERHSKRVSTMVSTCASHTACCMTGGQAMCKKSFCLGDGDDWYNGTLDTTVLGANIITITEPMYFLVMTFLPDTTCTTNRLVTDFMFLLLVKCSNNQWEKEWARVAVGWSVVSWEA